MELAKMLTDAMQTKDYPPEAVQPSKTKEKTDVPTLQVIPKNTLIVPYEPKWDDVPHFDLLSMCADLEQNEPKQDVVIQNTPNDQQVAVRPPLNAILNNLIQQRNSADVRSGTSLSTLTRIKVSFFKR